MAAAPTYVLLPEGYDPLNSSLDWASWLAKYEACASANQWNDEQKLMSLPPLLKGDCWLIYQDLPTPIKADYAQLTRALQDKMHFATAFVSGEKLQQRYFNPGAETLLSYVNDLKQLIKRAYPTLPAQHTEPILLASFIRGLAGASPRLAQQVRNRNPATLAQAIERAQFLMADPFNSQDGQPLAPPRSPIDMFHQVGLPNTLNFNPFAALNGTPMPPTSPAIQAALYNQQQLQPVPEEQAAFEQAKDEQAPPSWLPQLIAAIKGPSGSGGIRCDYCKKANHTLDSCWKKQRDQGLLQARQPPRPRLPSTPGATCTYCARLGHTEEQGNTKARAMQLKKGANTEKGN